MAKKENTFTLEYFGKNLALVAALVLIWRGIWHILDEIDIAYFGGDYFWTAVGGIALGLLILYAPDGDLKEIQKL